MISPGPYSDTYQILLLLISSLPSLDKRLVRLSIVLKTIKDHSSIFPTYLYNPLYLNMFTWNMIWQLLCIQYKAKLSKGKAFAVREKIGHSWDNLHGSMFVYLYCQMTQPKIHGKTFAIEWTTTKTLDVSPSKVLPCTVVNSGCWELLMLLIAVLMHTAVSHGYYYSRCLHRSSK